MVIPFGVLMSSLYLSLLEANTETISIYSVMATVSPPNQTRLFTRVTVYGPSTTSFVSRKYNLTDTSTFSSQEPESSEKAASLSLLTGDTITLLKVSASASFRSPETDKPIAWTTHGFYNVGFAESSESTAFQSTIAPSGPFSDSGAKTSIPSPVEKVRSVDASPLASTINVHSHAATRTLKNVGTVIRISPNSVSKHTLSSSETTANKWSDTVDSNSARGNSQRVTKQSWQTRFGQTIFSSVAASKSGSYSGNSEKLVELKTASMTMKQEMETISDLTTTSLDTSLSVKHSDSALFFKTFTESVMRSSFDEKWATSRPSSSSYIVTSHRMISSNTNLSFWPQWTTWTQQNSSSPHIATTGSMPIVFSLKLTSKTGTSVSSKFLVKETKTSRSPLATPLLSAQRLSTTEFVGQSERPSSTLSRGVSSPVITSSPSSLSSPRQESSTIKETQAIKPTMTVSGGIFYSFRTTVSTKVTTLGQREPSSVVVVYYKSVVSSNVHTGNIVAPQSNYLTTLTQLPTHDGSSALNDEPLTKTSQKYSTSLSSTRQSLAKAKQPSSTDAISPTNIPLSGPRTNAITLKPNETSDTLSLLSPSNTLGKLETVTCKATKRNTHSSPFQSNGASYRSTFNSKPTLRRMASFSNVESASTSVLAFPIVTSSFEHLMSSESINEIISLSKISPVSIKKLSSVFAYTLHRGASDTLMRSITASSTTALLSSARFLSTTELTSRKMTSNMFVLGLHSATSSVELLESKKSIQESLLRPTVTAEFLRTSHASHRLTTSTITGIAITTISPATRAASLSEGLLSSVSDNSTRVLSNTALSPQPMTNSTASASPVTHKTSTFQVTPSRNAVLSSVSLVVTILVPSVDPTLNSSASFKIMDGSLIIRNKNYHTNLSNPNTTMFKELAEEVESIIMEIVSLNTTDILDAEVTSFRNGSVIADFYLRVRYDSSLSDQQYTKLLSDANGTMWRGFYVTNITVTLRATEESSSKPSQVEDNSGLSKVAVIATLTVLAGLLIAVGSFGVYVCKKKGLCVRATVKPAE